MNLLGILLWSYCISPVITTFPMIGGVSRPNYGVDFNFLFQLNNMHGSWKHSWSIDLDILERVRPLPPNIQCSNPRDEWCVEIKAMLNETLDYLWRMIEVTESMNSWIDDPQVLETLNRGTTRRKRSLFPFIGDIEKFLFGVSTESDLTSIRKTLKDFEELDTRTVDQVTQLGENLASLTKVVRENVMSSQLGFKKTKESYAKLSVMFTDLIHRSDTIQSQNQEVHAMLLERMSNLNLILGQLFAYTVDTIQLSHADLQLLDGIQTILQGYIPISLIPPKDLIAGLQVANRGIRDVFPQGQLTYNDRMIGYYYTHKIVTPIIDSHRIMLVVDIPVDLGQQILNVYAIRTFPIPLMPYNPYSHHLNKNDTKIKSISELETRIKYYLVSQSGSEYSYAEQSQISLCKGETIKTCPTQFPLYPMSRISCLQALWKDAAFDDILNLCTYKLTHVPHALESQPYVNVVPLSEGKWYIDAPLDESWTVVCPQRPPDVRRSCTSCIIQVDCGCGIRSKHFVIPTRVTSCANVFSPLSHNFSCNPFSYLVHKNPWVLNLTGSGVSPIPTLMAPSISIPSPENWDDVMESMDTKNYDLNRIYAKQTNSTKMYRTTAEAILDRIQLSTDINNAMNEWPSWILETGIILAFINSGLILLIFYCFISRGVHATSVFDRFKNEPRVNNQDWDVVEVSLDLIILIIVCLILALQIITAWPIFVQWMRDNRWMRRFRGQGPVIKALGCILRPGKPVVHLQGFATFRNDDLTRRIPIIIQISSLRSNCHLASLPQEYDYASVDVSDASYVVRFGRGCRILTEDDHILEVDMIQLSITKTHEVYSMPERYTLHDIQDVLFSVLY